MNRDIPYLDLSLIDLPDEEWRDVIGWDAIYNVSNMGRVKSMFRIVPTKNGHEMRVKERILKQCLSESSVTVKFGINGLGYTQHVPGLVADAFMRDRKEGECICHYNKIPYDNKLSNLRILSDSESQLISFQRGVMVDWGIGNMQIQKKEKYLQQYGIYENGVLVGKICIDCNQEKPLSEFYAGYACLPCLLIRDGVKDIGKLKRAKDLFEAGLRHCSKCNTTKSLDEFHSDGPGRKRHYCKPCMAEKWQIYYNKRFRNKSMNPSAQCL